MIIFIFISLLHQMILDDDVNFIIFNCLTSSSPSIISFTNHKLFIIHPPWDDDIFVYVWLCQDLFSRWAKSSMNWCWWQEEWTFFSFLLSTICWHIVWFFRRMNQNRYSLIGPSFEEVWVPRVCLWHHSRPIGGVSDEVTHLIHSTRSRTSAICFPCASLHMWFLFIFVYYYFMEVL